MDPFQGEGVLQSAAAVVDETAVPLVCDLDGTVLQTDLMWECIVLLLRVSPLKSLLIIFWALRGRSHLKRKLAQAVQLEAACLRYRQDVLDFLDQARSRGRALCVATAADHELADRVAAFVGGFQHVYATSSRVNLKGTAKAELLRRTFGERGFDYLGDSNADLPVWRICRRAYVAGSTSLAQRVAKLADLARVFPAKQPSLRTWLKALRVHHWAKNSLLFVPLLLAHQMHRTQIIHAFLGFVLFGIAASSAYILNDIADLPSDRAHAWKSRRPIASGEISIASGASLAILLLILSLCGSFVFLPAFGLVVAGYVIVTLWYSARLKQLVLMDAFVLCSFYAVRLWAGGLIAGVPLSQWFLAFSMFFFLSLAMAKRYSELVHATELVQSHRSGRAYKTTDRELLGVLGVASSFAAVVILALYVQSPQVVALYRRPHPLLLICPILLYWLSRLWLQAYRGELYHDPVMLAMRDKESYIVAALILVIAVLAV